MNQNTEQDIEKLGKDLVKDIVDGTKTLGDVAMITSEFSTSTAKAVWDIIREFLPDVMAIMEDGADTVVDAVTVGHDLLPSNKTKATLSDGEIITEKYYQTEETFKDRIAKEEEHIKQYGNSGE